MVSIELNIETKKLVDSDILDFHLAAFKNISHANWPSHVVERTVRYHVSQLEIESRRVGGRYPW